MATVDVRTRTAADVLPVEAAAFFGEELPERFAERAELAAPGARHLGLRPFAVEVGGAAWTLAFDGDRFSVTPGADVPAAASLTAVFAPWRERGGRHNEQ